MMNGDKPFLCPVAGCGMRFTNEDHLNVHSKKHEMSLVLNPEEPSSSSSLAPQFVDQTPTPTKFLKNYDEISLFQDLPKNPFDDAYKKALDPYVASLLPGPQTGELNTPTLIMTDIPKSTTATAPSPLAAVDKTLGSESLKPSPLAKPENTNAAALDLSGKTIVSSNQPSGIATESVRKTLAARLASNANNASQNKQPKQEKVTPDPIVTKPQPQPSHSNTSTVPSSAIPSILPSLGQNFELMEVKQEPAELMDMAVDPQQQCTMQVLLQLPSGETVPISIPATINKLQDVKSIQNQQVDVQSLQPKPVASQNTNMVLKQRLKAQLQNQLSPTSKTPTQVLTSQNTFIPAASATPTVSGVGSSHVIGGQQVILTDSVSPVMMVHSPGSELNLSDSSDYSMDSHGRLTLSPEDGNTEERRRKFLERNRAAAARCRQKRKHWISNLERKADELTSTNTKLMQEVRLLRGEVAQLKTLLLAHKECPVTQQQKSQGQLPISLDSGAQGLSEMAQVVPNATTGQGQFVTTVILEPQNNDVNNK